MKNEAVSVSQFHALVNQTLEFAYGEIVVEGEVASYKVNQGKWVFFDLKDDTNVVGCFIPIFQLKTTIEDGMLVRVTATPQLTKWGKFSLTVRAVELAGEGSVKRAFELLKAQFQKEGLFTEERKRQLPKYPEKIALITSKQAAAYNDFITILNDRWRGLSIDHIQVQVQGEGAPDQIVAAIGQINQGVTEYEVLVLIRGGGSAEDLQAFNTEEVVRAVYGSKIPTLVGIGHEDDVSLAELAADVRAATPTDAARRLVPDRLEVFQKLKAVSAAQNSVLTGHFERVSKMLTRFEHAFGLRLQGLFNTLGQISERLDGLMDVRLTRVRENIYQTARLLHSLDPQAVLGRGYSIARVGNRVITKATEVQPADTVVVQLHQGELKLQQTIKRKRTDGRSEKAQTSLQL
jgi:exodeoxyribonuclease VII large subunit